MLAQVLSGRLPLLVLDIHKHSYLLPSAGLDIFAYGKVETLPDDAIHGTVLNIDCVASVLSIAFTKRGKKVALSH